MKKDITYEQRVFTNRIVDIDNMSVGNFTSKNIKELKQKDKVDGRFFHTSDTDEWFFCWGGELQKLNLKGVSLSEVVGLTGKIEESVKNANKTSADAKVAADAAVKNVESLSARIDGIESPSLGGYATEDFVNEKVANLVGSAPETLDTIGELSEALKNNKDLVDVLTNSIGTKQNVIEDLQSIREGAAAGATALQVVPEEYVTETELANMGYATTTQVDEKVDKDELKDYALKTDIPSTVGFTSVNSSNNLVKDSSTVKQLTIGSGLTSPNDNCLTIGRYNAAQYSWNAMLWIGSGTSSSARKNQMIVQENQVHYRGELKEASEWIGDFGEYFEWEDGNPNNEDRIGYMVQLNGNKIELAQSAEKCIGAISATCIITGGSCSMEWHGKFLKDDWGRELKNENGESIINPEYDPTLEYISRDNRPEWDVVGLLGQVLVRQDGTLKVNGYAGCINGVATDSDYGYRVLKIINENVALLLVK